MKTFTLFLCLLSAFVLPGKILALDASSSVKVTPLMKTSTSWNGKPLVYPQGQAEITGMLIEIAPGGETGWHLHPVPSFGIILEGNLTVTLKDGRRKVLKAGDSIAEVVNTLHNGRNTGNKPVKLLVYYAGAKGEALTVKK